MVMLSLQIDTPERWFSQVDENLDEILIDHAHCEKKAAGVAMNLLFAYVDNTKISRAMTEIVNEELEHFQMVLDLLERRDIQFRKLSPSNYGPKLHKLICKNEPDRAVDRLLVAGLIEARSCERFRLLSLHINEPELKKFYHEFMVSEAGHYKAFIQLARKYAGEEYVANRWQEWIDFEAEMVKTLEIRGDRMH